MDTLRVRVYNVRFGDALLVSIPDGNDNGEIINRHILIDVGNVFEGEGGRDAIFQPVIENIIELLQGEPLDLYVMSHEHLDHVQGLLYASEELGLDIKARYAWLTASAAEDYYENHQKTKKRLDEAKNIYFSIESLLKASPESETPWIQAMMLNNNPQSTTCCVNHLRHIADKTTYVYRGCDLTGCHPFHETTFEIWAPEEDTSDYYGTFQPVTLGMTSNQVSKSKSVLIVPKPPPGVDAGDFYNLVAMRRRGLFDNLLTIDKAANNTSVVFSIEWRGWRLLFPGDAERRSWKTMDKFDMLKPVHFMKVSHHGSHTGIPGSGLLEKILPETPPDNRSRRAVVCFYPGCYRNVPDEELLEKELFPRCDVEYVVSPGCGNVKHVEKGTVPDGGYQDFEFKG
jgi:hypothetical protein